MLSTTWRKGDGVVGSRLQEMLKSLLSLSDYVCGRCRLLGKMILL
jgi:hypothetical protein